MAVAHERFLSSSVSGIYPPRNGIGISSLTLIPESLMQELMRLSAGLANPA
jgi:hypothetical protein